MKKIAVCIPTYKRPNLLGLMVEDVFQQSRVPEILIVVDGDPTSGDVLSVLSCQSFPDSSQIVYIPSNHGNLAYQRYLGWRAAVGLSAEVIVYFDDDLRIYQNDVLDRVVQPLVDNNNY